MTAFGQAWGLVKEYSNHDLNYFFRGGHPKNTFEYGQQQVPDWRGKKEYSVLLDRVAQNKKPIASVVLDNYPNKEEVWEEITSKELDAMVKLISVTNDKLITQSDLVANLKFQTSTLNSIILQKDNQIETTAELSKDLQAALKKANRQKKLYQIGSAIGGGAVLLLLIQ